MKTLLLAATLLVSTAVVASASEEVEACVSFSDLANNIMSARQGGGDMVELYKAVEGFEAGQVLVKEAYKVPLFSMPENKQQAVDEFRNEAFSACLGMMEGRNI
jgi:hypothetical protein